MKPRHGRMTYFIEGEGLVDTEAMKESPIAARALTRDLQALDESEREFRFSRMFPGLSRFHPPEEALVELGQAMDETINLHDHSSLPAGYTYFGQFVDHDITFDKTAGLPSDLLNEDEIIQGRSPSLDLDSLYGRGPESEEKPLYEDDGIYFRIGQTEGFAGGAPTIPESLPLPHDLPRRDNPDQLHVASIGDPRNDENLAVAQTHLAFLKFHNVVASMLAETTGVEGAELFNRARRLVTLHYQWIVLHDFLPRVTDPFILRGCINAGCQFFQVDPNEGPTMPIEFSVAAYRFGHSMIRDRYTWNRVFPDIDLALLFVFSGVNGQMVSLPSTWPIDWRRFYDLSGARDVEPPAGFNLTRSIDTGLAIGLKTIPEFAQEGSKAPLAVRNLLRGRILGLPTGQDLARALNVRVMTPEEVRSGTHGAILQRHGFDQRTPLWYYILREAELFHNGERLGPVGSTILAETFIGLIQNSQTSILRSGGRWRPTLPSVRPGHFTMADLLLLVNELDPLGSQDPPPPPPPPPPPVRIHIAQRGETLSGLAHFYYGDASLWRVIFEANRHLITNPNFIVPGWELVIP